MMTQKLGNGFELIKKACFVCGSFNHLIKDCDFHDKKMVEKPVLNNKGRVTGQREIRPVWNNAQRVNHQNKFTHPHPKRNFVPTAVVTKSGQVPVNTAKQSSPRAATSISTARPVNTTAPKSKGNPRYTLQDQGVFNSGCSKHMTGNKSFLTDYQEVDGGFVAFAGSPKGGKITRTSKIRTGKLDFEDLLDESQVLLKVPRQNMYNFDLKSVVPSRSLTCLFEKATIDESNLWHRRLGHINFKTMNKLVRGNLVRGLPSKLFQNDHTCVACQKGKQHKASCKTKLMSSINQPLYMLYMDLFGPTSVRSINHKTYCLVVTNDYSRFSWVFFLATKDETSEILKTFITGIENQINYKVKIIRCDNGTEFKHNDMNQFCRIKGIKREFSVSKTLQQNKVAERKNKTLIEVARTMLTDSLLPTTFWAEAVSTACYVQNRVLVTKPHNKTPYELLHGTPPSISFMRHFGCPMTIPNTLDLLGKFDEKADEGFFVGYSINSKTFRVFNTRTRKVEENLHINFLENKPNVARSEPDWLFDIDLLTNSMNYKPVSVGNQTNKNAGIKDNVNAVPTQQYIPLPLLYDSPQSSKDAVIDDAGKKTNEKPVNEGERNGQEKEGGASNKENDQNVDSTVSPSVSTAGQNFTNADDLPTDPLIPDLEDIGIFSGAYNDEDVGAEANLNNLETTMNVYRNKKDERGIVVRNKVRLVAQGYTQEEGINYDEVFAPVARIEAIRLFLAYASFMGLIVYQMDMKSAFLYGTIEEEVAWFETLSTYLLENGYRRGTIDKNLFIKKDKGDILLVQVYVDDIIFGSTKNSLCVEFEQMMHKKFQMSSIGELTFFLRLQVMQKDDGIFISQDKYMADILKKFDFVTVKTTSTPIETNKALLKDEEAEDVDVHLYRSMIGSLMYLTASRPNIMFAVCACARDSPFDLEAFTNIDYAGASLDRKSTTGGCQFLGKRLISWQCKKQTMVSNSTTKVEYVAAANCCGQHIEIRYHFIRDSYEKKLIQVIKIHTDHNVADLLTKAFDVRRECNIQQKWMKGQDNPLIPNIHSHLLNSRMKNQSLFYNHINFKRPTNLGKQSSGPIHLVADEIVYKDWEDRMERAATTASSLEADLKIGYHIQKKSLDKENDPNKRKSNKTKAIFNEGTFDVLNDAMENVEGGSTAEQITTTRDTLNIASINMEYEELAQRLFEEEQAQFEKEFFVAQRAEQIRNKPPTRAQLRNKMVTYLKHIGNYTHTQLKSKSFEEIQKLYKKDQQWINDFVPMSNDSGKKDDSSSKQAESSKKRPRAEHNEESVKKHKLEDEAEREELRAYLDIVPRDDIAMDFEILAIQISKH
ncbi:putative ribonuclease H-like domain-containing protein [Tanacetum coccineum]|uniref:Ribonuclease H-like domain-containing protein n=1 Tax=Tanacetum coccineum TaxID=301880 RepID=A0ABQ4ZYP8_9ASTR